MNKETNDTNPRSFYVDTPVGKLFIHAKHPEKDVAEDYPGVWINFVTPESPEDGSGLIPLACVEYDPGDGCVFTDVYGDAQQEDITHRIMHENMTDHGLPYSKKLVYNYYASYHQMKEPRFDKLDHVILDETYLTEGVYGLRLEVMLDLQNYAIRKYIFSQANLWNKTLVWSKSFGSLDELNDYFITQNQADILTVEDNSWDVFFSHSSGRKWLKQQYPVGTMIRMVKDKDDFQPIRKGDNGKVTHIDDCGQIHIAWESGSSIALIQNVDNFEVIYRPPYLGDLLYAAQRNEQLRYGIGYADRERCVEGICSELSKASDKDIKRTANELVARYGLEMMEYVLAWSVLTYLPAWTDTPMYSEHISWARTVKILNENGTPLCANDTNYSFSSLMATWTQPIRLNVDPAFLESCNELIRYVRKLGGNI